jgi:hypothetical protein
MRSCRTLLLLLPSPIRAKRVRLSAAYRHGKRRLTRKVKKLEMFD